MEVIQKTILLETGKSHLPGFLPFLSGVTEENIGNYKGFVYDVDFSRLKNDPEFSNLSHLGKMAYVTMMNRYYGLMRFYKNCTYYRPIIKRGEVNWVKAVDFSCEERYVGNLINKDIEKTVFKLGYKIPDVTFLPDYKSLQDLDVHSDCIVGINHLLYDKNHNENGPFEIRTFEDYVELGGQLFYDFVTRAIGKIFVPFEIEGSLVPNYIFLSSIPSEISEMEVLQRCDDKRKFYEMGGDEYLTFLKTLDESGYIQNEIEYFSMFFGTNSIPKINLPIALNVQYDDLGIMEMYSKDWVKGKAYYRGDIVFYNDESYECKKDLPLTDKTLLGDFISAITAGYWERLEPLNLDNGEKSTITYRAESQLLSLKNPRLAVDDDGNEYQGYLVFTNGSKPNQALGPMFSEGKAKNIVQTLDANGNIETWGDMIISITDNGNTRHFTYVIGGKLIPDQESGFTYDEDSQTGVIYDEEYEFIRKNEIITVNEKDVRVEYDYIDFSKYEIKIENLSNGVIFSTVSHSVDDIYRLGTDGKYQTIHSVTFRTGKDLGIAEKKVWINNVDIDRGMNAAFENFYRLTEVNTFEDLANYQNNYFNLEN